MKKIFLAALSASFIGRAQTSLSVSLDTTDGTFVVGETDSYTLDVTASELVSGTSVRVTIPFQLDLGISDGDTLSTCTETWSLTTGFPAVTTSGTQSVTCTWTASVSGNYFDFDVGYDISDGSMDSYIITFGTITNPSTTETIDTLSITMSGTPDGSNASDLIPSFEPAEFSTASVSHSSSSAGAATTYVFTLKNTNEIPQNAYLTVEFPSDYSDVETNVNAASLTVVADGSTEANPTQTFNGQVVTISNILGTAAIDAGSTIKITWTSLTNPTSLTTTDSFIITALDANGNSIDQSDSGMTVTIDTAGDIAFTSFAFSSTTLGEDAYVTITMTPTVLYSTGGYIDVVPPENFFFAASDTSNAGQVTGILDTDTYTVTESGGNALRFYSDPLNGAVAGVAFTLNLGFWTIGYAATTTAEWEVYFKDSSEGTVAIATSDALADTALTLTGGTISVSSITRSSTTLGATGVTLTCVFTPTTLIADGNFLQIEIPDDAADFADSDSLTCEDDSGTTITCTWDESTNIVTLTSWCGSSGCTGGTAYTVLIKELTNPSEITLSATSLDFTSTTTISGTSYDTDTLASSVYVSNALTAGALSAVTATRTTGSTTTGATETWTFTATPANDISGSSTSGFRVYFPSDVGYILSSDSCSSTCASSADSDDDTMIDYIDVYACSSTCSAGSAVTFTVDARNSYHTNVPSDLEFTIQSITSTSYIDEGTADAAAFPLAGHAFESGPTINSPGSGAIVGDTEAFEIAVTLYNRLPSTSDSGSLVITFPSEMSMSGTPTCSAETSSDTLTCVVSTSAKTLTVTHSSELDAETEITVTTSDGIVLPETGEASSGFGVTSYYGSYVVDTDSTVTFSADTANDLTSVTVVRDVSTTGDDVVFTVGFTTTNPLPSQGNGGVVKLYIPTENLDLGSTPSPAISTSGATVTSHAQDGSFYVVEFLSVCTSSCTTAAKSFSFQVSGFVNAASTAKPTTSWKIETFIEVSSVQYVIDAVDTAVLATPYLKAGDLTSLSVARDTNVVADATALTIGFTIENALTATHQIYIGFPSQMIYTDSSSKSCTIDGGATTLTCSVTSSADDFGDEVTFIEVPTSSCPCTAGSAISLVISDLINPYSTEQITAGTISVSTLDSSDDVVDASEITLSSSTFSSLTANTLTFNSVQRSVTTVGTDTEIAIELTLTSALEIDGLLYINIPILEFVENGDTKTYKTSIDSTEYTLTAGTAGSTHQLVTITDPCNAAKCDSGETFTVTITAGYRNLGYVVSQSTYFQAYTKTADDAYTCNSDTTNTVATTSALAASTVTVGSVALGSTYVAASTSFTVTLTFSGPVVADDGVNIKLAFDTPFIRGDDTITCTDGSSSIDCNTPTMTSSLIDDITITGLCSSDCAASTTYTIVLSGVVNYLEVYAITGDMTVAITTDAGNAISATSSGYDYSGLGTLTVNQLTSVSVTRATDEQAVETTFVIYFTTPGILQDSAVVLVSLPINQIQITDSAYIAKNNANGSTLTPTVPAASSTYNYVKVTEWLCSSSNCDSGEAFALRITGASNPHSQSSDYDDFIIQIYNSAESALIFTSTDTTPLDADPELDYGAISSMTVTHGSSDTERTVSETTTYTFTFTTAGSVDTGGYFQITAPSYRIVLSGDTLTCTSDITGYTCAMSAAVTSDKMVIQFTGACASAECAAGTYTFSVTAGLQNPDFVPAQDEDWIFETADSDGYIINQGELADTEVTELIPVALTASLVSVTRASTTLAASSDYTFAFSLTTDVPSDGYFQLVLDENQVTVPSTPTCYTDVCSKNYETSDPPTTWILVEQNCGSSGCSAGDDITVTLTGLTNPSTLTANYPTTSFEIYTMTANIQKIDGIYADVTAAEDLVGEKVSIGVISVEDEIVLMETNVTISFAPGYDLSTAGSFTLTFPVGFAYPPKYDDICYIYKTNRVPTACTYNLDDDNEYIESIELTEACVKVNGCDADTYYKYNLPIINRGDTKAITDTQWFITTSDGGADVAIGAKDNGVTLEAYPLAVYEAWGADDCDQTYVYCELFLKFKLENPMTKSVSDGSSGGRISITLPSVPYDSNGDVSGVSTELIIKSTSCKASYGNQRSGVWCTVNRNTNTILVYQTLSDTFFTNNVTVKLNSVRNPPSTAPTSDILVYSQIYDSDDDAWYNTDGTETGFNYQVSRVGELSKVRITRKELEDGSGYRAGNPAEVLFELWPKHSLDDQASFMVQFPEAQLQINEAATTRSCYSSNANGFNLDRVYCEVNTANRTVIVRNYCVVADCGDRDVIRFTMGSDFLMNYDSVLPLNDSVSLSVTTTTDKTYYYVDQTTTGIFVKPDLKPNNLILVNPEVIRTNSYIAAKTSWVINFKINKNTVYAGGYLSLEVPKGVMMYMGETPQIYNYTDEFTEITGIKYTLHSDELSIETITVPIFCIDDCTAGKSYSIMVDRFRNPRAQLTSKKSIYIRTHQAEGYLVEEGETSPVTEVFSQLLPVKLQNVLIRPLSPEPGVTTDYVLSFSADAEFSSSDVLYVTFPPELEVVKYKGRMLATQRRCTSVFTGDVKVSCSEVSSNKVKITKLFPVNDKTYAVVIRGIKNMETAGYTSNFKIEVDASDGSYKAEKSTQLRISMLETIEDQDDCNRVCGSCAGTSTTCTACEVPSKYPIWKKNTCVNSCGDGFFFEQSEGLACYECHNACDTCYGPGNGKCFTCSENYYLNDGECLDFCPTGFTQDEETRKCIAPADQDVETCDEESRCGTCGKDTSVCLTCDPDSEFPILDTANGVCIKNDPTLCNGGDSSRWFINEETSQCEMCSALCKTCRAAANKCQSCWNTFTTNLVNELYETCVDRCGLGTFFNETATPQKCQFCNPVCLMCTGSEPTQCLACNKTAEDRQLFRKDNECVLSCPQSYSTNTQTNECQYGVADVSGFWFVYLILVILLLAGLVGGSRWKSKRADKWQEVLAGLLSGIEFFTRFFLLGNLWISTSVFLLSVCFMNMISTSAIGIFFNFLYMQPVYEHSPHFRTLFKQNRNAWIGVTISSYFGGVHLMRILTSKFFGKQAYSADLDKQRFFVQPINLMSNANAIFNFFQTLVAMSCFVVFAVDEDSFGLALVSFMTNGALLILHFFFHLKTKRFLQQQAQAKAEKQQQELDKMRARLERQGAATPELQPGDMEGPADPAAATNQE